jgi:hypothetical protein
MTNSVEEFEKKRYIFVPNAIDLKLVNFITQYALFDEMQEFSPESSSAQVPGAHSKYADPAMETLLLTLQPLIEEKTGLTLFPTYSYHRVYRNGDKLDRHTDRNSCEISATVCFNFSYEKSEYRWPIYIDGTPIYMNPGDIAIYHGMELNHWREPFVYPEEAWHVQAFIHYVDVNGSNVKFKFDERETVGMLKQNMKPSQIKKSYIQYVGN